VCNQLIVSFQKYYLALIAWRYDHVTKNFLNNVGKRKIVTIMILLKNPLTLFPFSLV